MNTPIREHNLRAAALWGSGGRAYDRISRSINSAIEHLRRPTKSDAWRTYRRCRDRHRLGVAGGRAHGAQVIGIDIAGPLLAAAREITLEQNLAIEYRLSDAEALPFSDGELDGVISTFWRHVRARSRAREVRIGSGLPEQWTHRNCCLVAGEQCGPATRLSAPYRGPPQPQV